MLEQLLQGTRMVDAVIALTLVEGAALVVYRRFKRRGIALSDFGLNLLAGVMLMLALRSNMAESGWTWTAAFLAAAGLLHATDLWMRWKE